MLFALEYMLAEFGTLPARYREVQEQVGTQVAPERFEQSQHVEATRATVDVKVLIEQERDRVQNVAQPPLPSGQHFTYSWPRAFRPRAAALHPDPEKS